jgi:Immunity protein 50
VPQSSVPNVAIIGAEKLTEVYGDWISFHDARLESARIERLGPTITIEFQMRSARLTCNVTLAGLNGYLKSPHPVYNF